MGNLNEGISEGYVYNYFRDYAPGLGRYLQSDPIGIEGGENPFTYVGNNPLSYLDPLGLFLRCA
jgi:RHS repeat-associated protein